MHIVNAYYYYRYNIYIYILKDVEVIKYFTVRITQTTYLLYKSRIIRLNAMSIEHVNTRK